MEYSCYYDHTNDRTSITVFVKKDDLVEVRFKNYHTFEDEDEYEDYHDNNNDNFSREFKMIVTFEQLKELKSLYNYYQLSLLLTENINTLKNIKSDDYMDGWAISSMKNWKGSYFTEKYDPTSYIFKNIPKEPLIDDIIINDTSINYYINTYETQSFLDESTYYMSKFMTEEEKKIEKELIQLEHHVSKEKIKEILSSRVKQFINEDTYKIILHKLLCVN